MAYTFEELKHKTVAELRKIAKETEHEAVKGASQMHKDEVLKAVCTALGIDTHVHHEVVGIDKTAIKTKIKALKNKRDEALAAKDSNQYRRVLRQIHHLKREIRRATV